MKLLSHLSPNGDGPPAPADPRRLALGLEAWHEALALAHNDPVSRIASRWSGTREGERLLAAIFGNSPFLSTVAVKEWAFLTRLVEEGADPVFAEISTVVENPEDPGEDMAGLMRRLRIAKRRTALLAAAAEIRRAHV